MVVYRQSIGDISMDIELNICEVMQTLSRKACRGRSAKITRPCATAQCRLA